MLNDPIMDASAHDYETEEYLNRLPHCHECGEPVAEGLHIRTRYGMISLDFWLCDECARDMKESAEDDYTDY